MATRKQSMNIPDKSMQKVYELNGIIHLPHYTQEGIYVSPGDPIGKIESHLVNRGAVEREMYIWDRHYNND
jgi:hypothetical protein